ncbi:MAG TPA: TonB-dependent receptor [Phenylobacterium sp.]|uniref:TonB-dependent receptor n=1 Tax=Phenylobacterium sp. TaxID=1871053 RepID=UPI002B4A47EA|nr:TonB-dependent receptor [Phenylobacterium sp.]HKR87602.1 TonB-dependent receptor [Phenylobacterium sp.]
MALGLASPAMAEAAGSGPAQSSAQLEEIVVVAQKRAENVQNVPIAITAVTSAQLGAAGVANTADLTMVTPSLNAGNNAGYFLPRMRGIGNPTFGPGIENAVATYLDGVYVAAVPGTLLSLNSVERVEILKGPQGTLFGRNATGGVINVISKELKAGFSGEANASYANYDTVTGDLYVTGGSDTFAADLSVHGSTQGKGYGRLLTTGRDINKVDSDVAARASFVFRPTDRTTIHFAADYANRRGDYPSFRQSVDELPLFGPPASGGPWDTNNGFRSKLDLKNAHGLALRVNQHLGSVELVSITGYRRVKFDTLFDYDLTPTPALDLATALDDRTFSQEFQVLSSAKGPFRWVGGLYYFSDKANWLSEVSQQGPAIQPPFFMTNVLTDSVQKTQSVAGFGQATYSFSDGTSLTAGLRYTQDRRSVKGETSAIVIGGIPIGVIQAGDKEKTFKKLTWRFALDHQFSRNVMAYASYNRGFKSGGFNATLLTDPPYDPEVLDAYEVGLKSDLFDRRLRLNAAAFYYDYSNIQVTYFPPTGQIGVRNGASADIYGFELDMAAALTDRLRVTGGLTWLDPHFGRFPNADSFVPTGVGGNNQVKVDATGNQIPFATKFTATLGAQYRAPLMGGEFVADGNALYNGGFFTQVDNRRRQDSYVLLNASLGWVAPNGAYSIRLWGKNLTNQAVLLNQDATVHATAESFQPPRTYGVTLGMKF